MVCGIYCLMQPRLASWVCGLCSPTGPETQKGPEFGVMSFLKFSITFEQGARHLLLVPGPSCTQLHPPSAQMAQGGHKLTFKPLET